MNKQVLRILEIWIISYIIYKVLFHTCVHGSKITYLQDVVSHLHTWIISYIISNEL